jgi:hypothetical protein
VNASDGVPCLWFFLPLPHPIGLPHGWVGQWGVSPEEMDRLQSRPPIGLHCSLMVHQIERTANVLVSDIVDVTSYAAACVRGAASPSTPPGGERLPPPDMTSLKAGLTIIEACVPTAVPQDERAIDIALDLALEAVAGVQRAVGEVSRLPVRIITRSHLPPVITVFPGHIHLDGSRPNFGEPVSHRVTGSAAPQLFGLDASPLSDAQLRRVSLTLDQFSRGHPYALASDLRREAIVQRRLDGSARLTVVTLATTGEVLLDSLLLQLAWEEGTTPLDAVKLLGRRTGHQAKVLSAFPPRLGGDWDPNGRGPVGEYFQRLVNLRHRVVHAGHNPTVEDMERAWQALNGLERHIGDCLSAPTVLYRYPRTAFLWAGESGLRRRGRWSKRFESFVNDQSQPNWISTFHRWRRRVELASDPKPPPPGSDPNRVHLYYEVRDGKERWALYDELTDMAVADVDPSESVTAAQRAALRATTYAANGEFYRSLVETDKSKLPSASSWVPSDQVFPELSVDPGPPPPPKRKR